MTTVSTPDASPLDAEIGVSGLRVGTVAVDRFSFERAVRSPAAENGLNQKLRLLALTLATYSNGKTGVARVSRPKLMEACGWKDHKSLTAHIKLLVKAGFVDYTPGGKGQGVCSAYQLTVPAHLTSVETPAVPDFPTAQDRPSPPQAVDAEVKEAALTLHGVLGYRRAPDLQSRIKDEKQDWPRLHAAVVARLKSGWDCEALMLCATERPLVDAGSIRTTVCRYFASRIESLGQPRPDQASEAGTAQLAAQVRMRAAVVRLNALGQESLARGPTPSAVAGPLQRRKRRRRGLAAHPASRSERSSGTTASGRTRTSRDSISRSSKATPGYTARRSISRIGRC